MYCYGFQLDKAAKIWICASLSCLSQGSRSLLIQLFCRTAMGKDTHCLFGTGFIEKDCCVQSTTYWAQPEVRLSCYSTREHDETFS